ncbi:hypothetical protein [Moraxella sp. RCAD0137]|uniref:hypothetical protein n=1 Tax=Moraxella sp. RCAD0137 TaxID=1775913 RepID=UPI000C9EFCDC|nr:hypothetical protein [Moraxella sp. RCAD0137]PNP98264.1 hypothetical protein AZ602_03515 [Moraxella sp. RCAD0137]
MQALVNALILVVVLAVFMLSVRWMPWVQKIWIKNGKWHTWRFMLIIMSLIIIQNIITNAFANLITAWLTTQGISFGVAYAVYALLVVMAVMLSQNTSKTSQTTPKWLGVGINVVLCVLMLSMPFW